MRKAREKKKEREREKGEEDREREIPGNCPGDWRQDLVRALWTYCFIENIKQI